jgi:proteasome accessory factor B
MSRQGTIRRYTLIIEKINHKQFPSFSEIQDYLNEFGFDVSRRTIERDIEAIRNEFGLEITFNRPKSGYFIDHDNSFNIESFLRFLEIVNTAELLTESLSDSKKTLDYISFDKGGGLKGIEHLKPMLQAIKEHRKIRFTHFNFQSEKSKKYSMSPYLLKEYQNRWYIVGVVSGINEMRTFGLDRISDLELRDDLFVPSPKINPQQNFDDAIGLVYSFGSKEKVVLSFTPSQGHYVKSLPMHKSQKILVDNADECRIELFLLPNFELKQQIFLHMDQVKVISPQWLVDEVKNHLMTALKRY